MGEDNDIDEIKSSKKKHSINNTIKHYDKIVM